MIRVATNRTPTHPGEMLLEEFLTPMGIIQRDLANAIHVVYQHIMTWSRDGGAQPRAVLCAWQNYLVTRQISG